jgi:flagellar hook-associated protein 2
MAEPLSSISGLSSGIDSKALVEQIMLLERRPAVRLESSIEANKKKAEAFTQFKTLLTAFRTAAEAFKKGTGLSALSTTVSGTDSAGRTLLAATASATSGATAGSYQVEVTSLARAQKSIGAPQPSASQALDLAGTVDVKVGGVALGTLTLAGTETLTEVRDKLNTLAGTPPKFQATILSASPTDQRLVLTGTQPGSAGAFAFEDTAGTAAATLGLTGTPYLDATDASLVIDGVPITRTSNTVADAIPGVTLTLSAAEVGKTATVNVERFPSAATDAAKAFVEAYNKIVAFTQVQATTTATVLPLRGDSMLRTVRASINKVMLGSGTGLPDDMARLGSAGMVLQKDGTLSLNAETFSAAYASRQGELSAMLAERGAAIVDQVDVFTATGTGMLDARTSALTDRNATLASRVSDVDSRLEKKRATLLAQYAKFEASLGKLRSIGDSLTSQLKSLSGRDD